MDYPVINDRSPFEDAVVVWAGRFQFGAGERLTNRAVASRALIWLNRGAGTIASGRRTFDLSARTALLLPWLHDVTYQAALHDPFMVSAIHIVPRHDASVPVELGAAHGRHDRLAGLLHRRDSPWDGLSGIVVCALAEDDPLRQIADSAVEHVVDGQPSEATLRALAVLILTQIRKNATGPPGLPDQSDRLTRMQTFILNHLQRPLTVAEVAHAADISESTAQRLFRLHTNRSLASWVLETRLATAKEALQTTSKSVAEVAREVGVRDPAYFSRAFRRRYGAPPRTYASRSRFH